MWFSQSFGPMDSKMSKFSHLEGRLLVLAQPWSLKPWKIHNFWATTMILDFLEMANLYRAILRPTYFHSTLSKSSKMEKPKFAFLIYCNSLHKHLGCANTIKRPSRWLNLDILESIGPRKWDNHIARSCFKLFVKQCHPNIHSIRKGQW